MQATGVTEIYRLLSPKRVRVGLPGQTKEEVLTALVALLDGHPHVRDLAAVEAAVHAREQMMSTGVGKGLALPHAKTDAVSDTVAAFAITAQPIDYLAIDDAPVQQLFLLVGPPASKSSHIKILSRISRLMNRDDFREQLLAAEDTTAVLALVRAGEASLLE